VAIPFELHVALRYLLARRKQARIGVISTMSALGVAVGVAAVIIALALMTGLQQEVRERILGSSPHLYVWKQGGITDYRAEAEKMRALPRVIGAAPAILTGALVSSAHADEGVYLTIKGIDPGLETGVTDLGRSMVQGSVAALAEQPEGELGRILLGADAAAKLQVQVGDIVSVLTPFGTMTPRGLDYVPKRLEVAGLFRLGLYEFDTSFGFAAIPVAQRLAGRDDVQLMQLRVDDMWVAPEVADRVPEALGLEYIPDDWQDMNGSLFAALWLEKVAISLAIGLIVFVAALNIVASLILIVMEKHRDIAILKTMGTSARSVTAIFVLQGLIIGVVGTAAGAALGVAIAMLADHYQLISVPADVYQVTHMPFTVMPVDLTLVVLGAVFVCFVATIYPSRQAAKLDPAQALRYE
jgi:lipoprotein-releasing system permease protein